tara:strand:- start:537 stop:1859 length:1323 start_codon:yes stop_codon:yes gene_type:complete
VRVSIFFICIFLISCDPVNNKSVNTVSVKNPLIKDDNIKILKKNIKKEVDEIEVLENSIKKKSSKNKINEITNATNDFRLRDDIEIILPLYKKQQVTNQLIKSFQLAIYEKKIKNLSFGINNYSDLSNLKKILEKNATPGKIFIGTLSTEATKIVKTFCNKGILFFSFSSEKSLASDCVYLVNFFPEDDLNTLFDYFPAGSKIALLYPENKYGYNINKIIDTIAEKSSSLIINRSSYKTDLTNARESIKELGKYELRKYELERQKQILKSKNDVVSKKALKKIQKFETTDKINFTHLILPDYNIRLLQIAPLLPFYDIDPNKVQFVGTGVWDDSVFFDEPSLQNAIFSGIEENKRNKFFRAFEYFYDQKPMRTATIPYDLSALLSYIIAEDMTLNKTKTFLNNSNIAFDGMDGSFIFSQNVIVRKLDILKIKNGTAKKLN